MDTRFYELIRRHETYRQEVIKLEQEFEDLKNNPQGYFQKRELPFTPTTLDRLEITNQHLKDFYYYEIHLLESDITQIQNLSRAIAEVCVVKNLPGGDPCWMTWLIGTYIDIPLVDD
jgi:hypothetical protein